MLLHKDLGGEGDVQEMTALKGMLSVGNEFMTSRDEASEVHRAGDVVTMIRRTSEDVFVRWITGWELVCGLELVSSNGGEGGLPLLRYLTDRDKSPAFGAPNFIDRTLLFYGYGSPDEAVAQKAKTYSTRHSYRVPRNPNEQDLWNWVDFLYLRGLIDAEAANQKPRIMSLGDGTAVCVCESVIEGDTRFLRADTQVNRAAKVTLWHVVPHTDGKRSEWKELFSFSVRSGYGFALDLIPSRVLAGQSTIKETNPGERFFFQSSSNALLNGNRVRLFQAGLMGGVGDASQSRNRERAHHGYDQSGYYAVSEPAWARVDDKRFLSIVALHGQDDDAYSQEDSTLFRLTCTYTTPDGIQTSKLPSLPNDYVLRETDGPVLLDLKTFMAPYRVRLHRLSPLTLVAQLWCSEAYLSGLPGDVDHEPKPEHRWSQPLYITHDAGQSWEVLSPNLNGEKLYSATTAGAWIPAPDEDSFNLVCSGLYVDSPQRENEYIEVHNISAQGVTLVNRLDNALLSDGLAQPAASASQKRYPPYSTVGNGGWLESEGVRWQWVQLDPQFHENTYINEFDALAYPQAVPQLLLSKDNWQTCERRFLPSPWPHRLGFVQLVDAHTLGVLVLQPRSSSSTPITAVLYTSRDTGVSWKATRDKFTIPSWAMADGGMLGGWENLYRYIEDGYGRGPFEDFYDWPVRFFRGELMPLVMLRDKKGRVLPSNLARPWAGDADIKRPDNEP